MAKAKSGGRVASVVRGTAATRRKGVVVKRGKSNIELTPKQVIAELREDVRDLNAERKVMIKKLAKCETLADQIFDRIYELQDANQELRDVIEGFY